MNIKDRRVAIQDNINFTKIWASPSQLVSGILQAAEEDVEREGLTGTPDRYIKFLEEFLSPKEFNFTTFENDGCNEMIVVKDMPFYSLCEHHMVPFFGTAAIAYIPSTKIVGLSKLPRVLDMFSRRLQNQERITTQVANFIQESLSCRGVAVVLNARHMCMEMRGIKSHGANTTTSAMRGVFETDFNCRQEFLNLIKK
jgi:GTP cyclohydrolase I